MSKGLGELNLCTRRDVRLIGHHGLTTIFRPDLIVYCWCLTFTDVRKRQIESSTGHPELGL
jgi:hypothetical protein